MVKSSSLTPKKRELLSNKVYKYLKNEIIQCLTNNIDLNLSENYLSTQLMVSRTPIREALNRLAVEGFVINYPNYGSKINKVSIDDLKDLVQIRIAIEGLAINLLSVRIDKEKINEFKKLVNLLKQYVSEKDILSFCEVDIKFHDMIIEYCGNRKLKNIYENLKSQSLPFRIKSFSRLSRLEESCQEIENIVLALEKKQHSKALSLFQEHISNGYTNILFIEKN